MIIKREKLWGNNFDIRDYEIVKAEQNHEGLRLVCKQRPGEYMDVSIEELKKKAWTTGKPFKARFALANGRDEYLIWSIPWRASNKAPQQELL
jgi:hypothetical protein